MLKTNVECLNEGKEFSFEDSLLFSSWMLSACDLSSKTLSLFPFPFIWRLSFGREEIHVPLELSCFSGGKIYSISPFIK